MQRRHLVIAALISAILSGLSIFLYARDLEQRSGIGGEETEVLIATRAIATGAPLVDAWITTKRLPSRFTPSRAVPTAKKNMILGNALSVPLKEGDIFLWSDLNTGDGRSSLLADVIPEGTRALAIPITSSASLGELLRPNDHVDILGTFSESMEKGRTTVTLLQNVTVLAVGKQVGTTRTADGETGTYTNVHMITICVTPEEAEFLIHAMDRGKLSMTLRNQRDLISVGALGEQRFASLFEPEVRRKIQTHRDKIITIITPNSR